MTARDDLVEGQRLAWRRLKLLGRGVRWLVIAAVALVMLAINVATLTLSGVNAFASATIEALTSIESVSTRERRAREATEEGADEARRAAGLTTAERDRLAGRAAASDRDVGRLRREANSLRGSLEAEGNRRVLAELDLGIARADLGDLEGEVADLRLGRDALAVRVDALSAELFESREAYRVAEAAQWIEVGGERLPVREAVARTTGRIRDRTAQVATANLGSMVGESIPFYGIAVVVVATTFELGSACQSMQDVHELEVALGVADPVDEQVSEVCGLKVPTAGEVWALIRASPGAAWDGAATALGTLGEIDLPRPDFGGV